MEGSPERHAVYESDLPAKGITNGKTSLHAYSDTRWTARSDNLEVVLNVFRTLLSMIEEQSNTGDNVATGLLVRLTTFRFMASCIVLKECFSISRSASEYLQREEMDLVSGVSSIEDLKRTLASYRSDESFERFVKDANAFAEKIENETVVEAFAQAQSGNAVNVPKWRRTIPSHFADSLLGMAGLPHTRPDSESELQLLKRELHFPFLDKMSHELEKRFSNKACELMSLSAAFHPRHLDASGVVRARKLAKKFNLDEEQVGQQFLLFSNSSKCCSWKTEYALHLEESKEKKEKQNAGFACHHC